MMPTTKDNYSEIKSRDAKAMLGSEEALSANIESGIDCKKTILMAEAKSIVATIDSQRLSTTIAVSAAEKQKLIDLHFSAGDIYHQLEEYKAAYEHYQYANELVGKKYDIGARISQAKNTIYQYSQRYIDKSRRDHLDFGRGANSDQPIFLVGMPFSGSTLVEELLVGLSDIVTVNSADIIEDVAIKIEQSSTPKTAYTNIVDYISQDRRQMLGNYYLQQINLLAVNSGGRRIIDNTPGNSFYIGFILDLFPKAKIIYVSRDSRDACLACYFHQFKREVANKPSAPYSYDLNQLSLYSSVYSRMMAHWQDVAAENILALRLEDFVDNASGEIDKIAKFCGLTPQQKMNVLHRSIGPVESQLINSIGLWKHYDCATSMLQQESVSNEISELVKSVWWLNRSGKIDEAMQCCKELLQIDSGNIYITGLLGQLATQQGDTALAIEMLNKAIEMNPYIAEFYCNLGLAQQEVGHYTNARENLCKAISIKPEFAIAQYNLSMVELVQGDLNSGWRRHEWRWKVSEYISQSANSGRLNIPVWDGTVTPGMHLCITSEQGIGDAIMYFSCIPDLIEKEIDCVAICHERLRPIFQRSFPKLKFIEDLKKDDPWFQSAVQIPMASLPNFFRRGFSDFPEHQGYLQSDPQRSLQLRNNYRSDSNLVVGISWLGGKVPKLERKRNISLVDWEAILRVPGVDFVSLQYGDVSDEINEVSQKFNVRIIDDDDVDPLKDMDAFAAQVGACDLVISTDNSTVHMAGAMGVPVWTLLSYAADWRWLVSGNTTHWYPSMQLVRRSRKDDWNVVIDHIAKDLAGRTQEKLS